jgi:hypothetical protein
VSWSSVEAIDTDNPALTTWEIFKVSIPESAQSTSTQFRWRQLSHSGENYDLWAIDDLSIYAELPAAPSAPPFFITTPNSSTSIAIYWIESELASYYTLERRTTDSSWSVLTNTPASQCYFTDSTCVPGTSYAYRVKAGNAGGESTYSSTSIVATYTQYEDWLADNYGTTEASGSAAPLALDANGIDNLTKYAFNMTAGDSMSYAPETGICGIPASWMENGVLNIEFVRRTSSSHPGISYTVQVCETLGNCKKISGDETTDSIDDMWERVKIEDLDAPTDWRARFIRVLITME